MVEENREETRLVKENLKHPATDGQDSIYCDGGSNYAFLSVR